MHHVIPDPAPLRAPLKKIMAGKFRPGAGAVFTRLADFIRRHPPAPPAAT